MDDLETRVSVLEQLCKDCKLMQDERLKFIQEAFTSVNKVIGEVKECIKVTDQRNINWHIANLCAVAGGFFTLIVATIVALLKYVK